MRGSINAAVLERILASRNIPALVTLRLKAESLGFGVLEYLILVLAALRAAGSVAAITR